MEDSIFIIFISFGVIWILLAAGAWIALLKADGQKIRIGAWGLVVVIPILLPFLAALIIGALSLQP